MALDLADRVGETTTTTGTGTISLAGAKNLYRSFVAASLNGLRVPYVIAHQSANEWEVGEGVITSGSPDTLSRLTVRSSSNSGSLVNFSSGTKDVYLTGPSKLFQQMGSPYWVSVSPTTADITATVNRKYAVSASGLTDNRNFKIPAGEEGDFIELIMTSVHNTYALILIGDTGVSINGGSAATEWSRLFILNETIRFECTSTNNWRVRTDRRKQQIAKMYLSAFATGESSGTYTRPTAASTPGTWSPAFDNANLLSTSNDRVYCRRDGKYLISCGGAPYGGGTSLNYWNLDIRKNNSTTILTPSVAILPTNVNRCNGSAIIDMAAGDYVNYYYRNNNPSSVGCTTGEGTTFLSLVEQFE